MAKLYELNVNQEDLPFCINIRRKKRVTGYVFAVASAMINGRSVWLFGDTFLVLPNADNHRTLSNSSSSTFDMDAGDGIFGFEESVDDVGAPLNFFPFTEEESAFNRAHQVNTVAKSPVWRAGRSGPAARSPMKP